MDGTGSSGEICKQIVSPSVWGLLGTASFSGPTKLAVVRVAHGNTSLTRRATRALFVGQSTWNTGFSDAAPLEGRVFLDHGANFEDPRPTQLFSPTEGTHIVGFFGSTNSKKIHRPTAGCRSLRFLSIPILVLLLF